MDVISTEQKPLDRVGRALTRSLVAEALLEVIDPELGVNIVDLGLVYGLLIENEKVTVTITLTTPSCPLGGYIEDDIHEHVLQFPQVRSVVVEQTWEPPWSPDLISETARRQLRFEQ